MRKHFTKTLAAFAALCTFSLAAAAPSAAAEGWKSQLSTAQVDLLEVPEAADRLILVEGYDGTQCRVSLYTRASLPASDDAGTGTGTAIAAAQQVSEGNAANETSAQMTTPAISGNSAETTYLEETSFGPGVPLQPTSSGESTQPAQVQTNGSNAAVRDWQLVLSTNGALGANGIGKEREGDSKTPQGLFAISPMAFGNADAPENCALPYHKVTPDDYWCGDSASPYYDQLVDISETGRVFDTAKSEHLIDYGRYYNYCLNIEYNKDHTPYKGSALFLHCNRADGSTETTHGCISINQDVMVEILTRVSQDTWILIDNAGNIPAYYR